MSRITSFAFQPPRLLHPTSRTPCACAEPHQRPKSLQTARLAAPLNRLPVRGCFPAHRFLSLASFGPHST